MNFKQWLEDETPHADDRPVVSFDFDGVLHRDIYPGTHHPLDHNEPNMTPNEPMHDKLREEARQNRIVITSARCPDTIPIMKTFLKSNGLSQYVTEIVATCNKPKLPELQRMKVIRHYDDHPRVGTELQGSGIEFVLVKVKSSQEH
jgi:hypothetical protein